MLYDLSMSEIYIVKNNSERIVYVIQEIPGTKAGNPKINIMGALSMVNLNFCYQKIHK